MKRPHPATPWLLAGLTSALLAACSSGDHAGTGAPTAAAPAQPAPQAFHSVICVNGHCAVIDQAASLLVPFDNDEDSFAPFLMSDTLLLQKGEQWRLLDARSKAPIKTLGQDIYNAAPNYFGFGRDGKVGVMDFHGNEVQPARFDEIFSGGDGQYIGYTVDGKSGILDAHGKQLTDPVYDNLIVRQDFSKRGNWVIGERGEQHWAINLKDGTQKQVDYGDLDEMHDGHMVASSPDLSHKGLVDASGALAIPLKYDSLGTPSEGLVSFREHSGAPCGYLDYSGKVVIPAHFGDCLPFGKKGALAKTNDGADGDTHKYGVIGRDGAWVLPPTYDYAGEAGRSLLGMFDHVPGHASVFKQVTAFSYTAGIYDLDQGREQIPPTYPQIGMLTNDRFAFSGNDAPQINLNVLGQTESTPAMGVMDGSGKVLLKPDHYADIRLDEGGRYLRARDGAERSHEALLDLDGRQLVPADAEELVIDQERAVILAYDHQGEGDDAQRMLRAAYDLQGKPLFAIRLTECGAEQLLDGHGKVIWPQDPKPYCPKETAATQTPG